MLAHCLDCIAQSDVLSPAAVAALGNPKLLSEQNRLGCSKTQAEFAATAALIWQTNLFDCFGFCALWMWKSPAAPKARKLEATWKSKTEGVFRWKQSAS
jgi:hypothetical protein